MSGKTAISWTDRTWNPVVGCTKVSQGCKFCYAKRIHDQRHAAIAAGAEGLAPQYREPFEVVQLMHDRLTDPLSWRQPSRVFVNSVSDLFHEQVPFEFIRLVFGIMMVSPRHTYQILTKRPARMREFFGWLDAHPHKWPHVYQLHAAVNDEWFGIQRRGSETDRNRIDRAPFYGDKHTPWPLANVWLGVSVENQAAADERVPLLLQTPAAHRFLSCEPLLGPVDLTRVNQGDSDYRLDALTGKEHYPGSVRSGLVAKVDLVIVGGESGARGQAVRPMHPYWARSLRDQCIYAGTGYEFKQWGEYAPTTHLAPSPGDQYRCIRDDGHEQWLPSIPGYVVMERVGTKRAGRELDGRTYDASWGAKS